MQKLATNVVTLSMRLDADLRDAFKTACSGRDMSSVMRDLMRNFIKTSYKARHKHGQGR